MWPKLAHKTLLGVQMGPQEGLSVLLWPTFRHQNLIRNGPPRYVSKFWPPQGATKATQGAPKAPLNNNFAVNAPQGRLSTHPRGTIWGPRWHPRRTQNRSKIKLKNGYHKNSSYKPSWNQMGPILCPLGLQLGVKNVKKYCKTYYFVKNHVFEKSGVLKFIGTYLGSIWGHLGAQKGAQEAPQAGAQTIKKEDKIQHKIWKRPGVPQQQVAVVVWVA